MVSAMQMNNSPPLCCNGTVIAWPKPYEVHIVESCFDGDARCCCQYPFVCAAGVCCGAIEIQFECDARYSVFACRLVRLWNIAYACFFFSSIYSVKKKKSFRKVSIRSSCYLFRSDGRFIHLLSFICDLYLTAIYFSALYFAFSERTNEMQF